MLELALTAEPSALTQMADAVEAFAAADGVPQERAMQLVVVLDEIVTNIIAYGGLRAGDRITVTVERCGAVLAATVEDPGAAFDPLQDAPPAILAGAAAERPIGGLGLHIVRTIARRVVYERREGRNRLVLELAP